MSDLFLIVLWRKARPSRERIFEDLEREFTVVERFEVHWPWWKTPALLRAFYSDWRWLRWIRKALTCGAWSFEAALVRDDRPNIATRHEGEYCMDENKRVRDAKKRYREWTGGRWRVHASASAVETAYQYRFLTGHNLCERTRV